MIEPLGDQVVMSTIVRGLVLMASFACAAVILGAAVLWWCA